MSCHLLPSRAFYFVRHGETQFNLERRFQGSIDVPLNQNGVEQAREAAKAFAGHRFTRIISSPASRALQTAHFIAEAGGQPIHVEKNLMEFSVGSLEGQSHDTTRETHELAANDSFLSILPDDADNWNEFAPRVCTAVKHWTDRYADETLLIASHGLVFRALAESLLGKRISSQNGVPYHFKPNGNAWDLVRIGEG